VVAVFAGQGDHQRVDELHARIRALRSAHDLPAEPATLRLSANMLLSAHLRFRDADEIGRQLLDSAGDDDVVRTEGHYVRGVCRFWLGDLAASEQHLAAALASFHPEHALRHLRDFGQDPRAICLVRAGLTAWQLGDAERARTLRTTALEAAVQTGHAYTEAYVRCFGAWLACEEDDVETVTSLVDVGDAFDANEFPRWSMQGLRAWVTARRYGPAIAIPALEEVLERIRGGTVQLWRTWFDLMLASLLIAADDPSAAQRAARRARLAAASEIPIHLPEALRLEALAGHDAGTDPIGVDRLLADALGVAQEQGSAPYVERARKAIAHVAVDRGR
jgi:hypothetical protein